MGFPSLSMAPSATMMMFNLWPESLASLNFLQSLSGQLTSGGHSGIKTKSASETMAATWQENGGFEFLTIFHRFYKWSKDLVLGWMS